MLEPREADIPVLFLVLVVLPLVAYILLGKWSEVTKKRERISLLAQLAAEEAFKAEAMAVGNAIPLVSSSKSGLHVCARCFAPAKTRCSRCKSIRYCSGKCQIIHWRQAHKQECQQLETTSSSSSSPKSVSVEESLHGRVLHNDYMNSQFLGYDNDQGEKVSADDLTSLSFGVPGVVDFSTIGNSQIPILERTVNKRVSHKPQNEILRGEDKDVIDSCEDASKSRATHLTSDFISSKEAFTRHRSRKSDSVVSEVENLRKHNVNSSNVGQAASKGTMHGSDKYITPPQNTFEPRKSCGFSSSSCLTRNGTNAHQMEYDQDEGDLLKWENSTNAEKINFNSSYEMTATNGNVNAKSGSQALQAKISKLPKSTMKVSGEQYCSELERKGHVANESNVARMRDIKAAQGSNGVERMGIMKMVGLRKSTKLTRQDAPINNGKRNNKLKMLFPYEEFVKFFQCEVFDLSPRGLLNCGNSCYANAVLQCLTCTKPLITYLIHRSHSRACCVKGWCLMCELEQHAVMLRESGGPLSLSRILMHIRSINFQIGDGSQEDAHEFLRLIIASMQSICLEGLGGEKKVDPILQETTFIQHIFGGRLRSKVKCMICHQESERYENMMDLTLEIYGWVESLEDALTQFTATEDLDGENMYRCGRCATYVRARKELSIHEAPNILTIVLKRFQEGRYGKISKRITFPDMLDMIPFMTRTEDMPPLYLLYAVVVHLDTLNASFSGHYVSYVKDMRGNWFRIDDTEVQPVPMSQVMSEGAYILFYMRSCPLPQRTYIEKTIQQQVPDSARNCISKAQKLARTSQSRPSSQSVGLQDSTNPRPDMPPRSTNHTSNGILKSASRNVQPVMEAYAEPVCMDFSNATSSDWSLFTSSDEASFTTESTRDSFSTVDYADTCNADTISSIFNTLYAPEYSRNSDSCRKVSNCRPHTRFVSEQKGHILDSYLSTQPLDKVQKRVLSKQVSDPSSQFPSDSNCNMFVKYGSNPIHGFERTSDHCKL
ncbi:ubiquitin carboxyl-terminal hydrolase 15 isoform X2 [Quercus robur]|uniref:ubiquitin carboxyl-terminal hydrolase 15 isoform X2 n=1 Tax=Quercus robur TaxID=38942 RepID=UPI002162D04D|nr:ubiquitin carboxyl-terminal hydrolase 15 isoform X2 [Quercus robur]